MSIARMTRADRRVILRAVAAVIESLRGPLVELRAETSLTFSLLDRLVNDKGAEVIVASVDRNLATGIAQADHESLIPGARFWPEPGPVRPLTPERMIEVGLTLDRPSSRPEPISTGIRVIDLLCPLLDGGCCWLLGAEKLGRQQLLEELQIRLSEQRARQTLVFPIGPENVAKVRSALARPGLPPDVAGAVRRMWLVSEHFANPVLADLEPLGTSRLFLGPRAPARGYWPAVDPFASHSNALAKGLVDSRHVALAAEVLEHLAWAEQLREDPTFTMLAHQRRFREAIARTVELGFEVLLRLDEAEHRRFNICMGLERYFAQPFYCGEAITGLSGTHVDYGGMLRGCRDVLDGRPPRGGYDHPARIGSDTEMLDSSGSSA